MTRSTGAHPSLVFSATLVAATAAALSAGCPPPASTPFTQVIAAQKSAGDVVARGSLFAYRDGLEASSDGADVGVDVVVAERGAELLRSPTEFGLRGIALGDGALATIEIRESIADQHVRVRALDGGGAAIDVERVEAPLAIAAVDDVDDGNGSTVAGFLWIEAAFTGEVDGLPGIGAYALAIVEGRADGTIAKRTPIDVGGGVQQAFGILAPIPIPFGVVVAGDTVFFGWTGVGLCNGSSVLYRASRADGIGSVDWTGRVAAVGPASATCDCVDTAVDNVSDRAAAVTVVSGVPVVVGGVVPCASVVDAHGFVRNGGNQVEADDALSFATLQTTVAVLASDERVFTLRDTKLEGAVEAPSRVTGLSALGGLTVVATPDGIFQERSTPSDG